MPRIGPEQEFGVRRSERQRGAPVPVSNFGFMDYLMRLRRPVAPRHIMAPNAEPQTPNSPTAAGRDRLRRTPFRMSGRPLRR